MFKENSKAIYLQIADRICDDILGNTLKAADRLPSVREYAATVQVNPNTMMRTYEWLSARSIIFNRRGIGYFVADDAADRVKELRREELLGNELTEIFRQLELLGITPDELCDKYKKYLSSNEKK
ncbi:MAG: GntR family transcriptional regulator [Bacteroidales bacterium]|nr:GntR family transcriptional regulator [Bacteroidales bacterium]